MLFFMRVLVKLEVDLFLMNDLILNDLITYTIILIF